MNALDTLKEENDVSHYDTSIPEECPYKGKNYKIEIIKKEAPEEMVSFSRHVMEIGDYRQFINFMTLYLMPYVGFSTILFWEDTKKIIYSYIVIAAILVFEAGAHLWKCRESQKELKKLFPHIKVSDESGVITTMTPKAYVGQISMRGIDWVLTILPARVRMDGHRHSFVYEKFISSLENALRAREQRLKKA